MASTTVITSQTAAVLHTATDAQFDASAMDWCTVHADNLATTEEVDVYIENGATWKVAIDRNTGNAIVLTATDTAVVLAGGNRYAFAKDATAGACAVTVTHGRSFQQ